MLDVNTDIKFIESWEWLSKIISKEFVMDIKWLGDGNTSQIVIDKLKKYLI